MRFLKTAYDYFFYCGAGKDEYNAVKKDAYVSNYKTWRFLHLLMVAAFTIMYLCSLVYDILDSNRVFYLFALVYSVIASILFFIMKKDSLIAQLMIYLSISLLFFFACLITQNKPDIPATMFIALLLIAPVFMIDKPVFMTIELIAASAVFLLWMYNVKPYNIWQMDFINVIIFLIVGTIINFIANSIRIKEFILTRKIAIQKDTDELTGLMNKGALIREIQAVLDDKAANKGILFVMDVDHFKKINDTYGHNAGDYVLQTLAGIFRERLQKSYVCRWGGEEFLFLTEGRVEDCRELIESLRESVEKADFTYNGSSIHVTITAGIEPYDAGRSTDKWIQRADEKLYYGKENGRNRVVI